MPEEEDNNILYFGDLGDTPLTYEGFESGLLVHGGMEVEGSINIHQDGAEIGRAIFFDKKTNQLSILDEDGSRVRLCFNLKTGQFELFNKKIIENNKKIVKNVKNNKKVTRYDILDID